MSEFVTNILDYANKLIFAKNYEKAWDEIENILSKKEFENDLLIHLRKIELASKLNRAFALDKTYTQILNDGGDNKLKIAQVLLQLHGELISPTEAAAKLQELLTEVGNYGSIHYGIGFCMEIEGDHERAIYSYEQCIKVDPTWFPSYFGLSQIHYHLGDQKAGDHYFYQFEAAAPYNVYGNFDTHRKLAYEFLEKGAFGDAETTIMTLSEWWIDNKGICPPEIQIFESLLLSKISENQNDPEKASYRKGQALLMAEQILLEEQVTEGILYFIAKALEEFSEFGTAFKYYKRILAKEGNNPAVVHKIGSQFLSIGEFELAKELFDEAYIFHPDNPEVRFCKLVANLKLANIAVEDYLVSKERMKKLVATPTDKVELLALLHNLLAIYQEDPDVHGNMGEIYLKLGYAEKAAKHFVKMYELDNRSYNARLRYVAFELQHGNEAVAAEILVQLEAEQNLSVENQTELHWMRASLYYREGDYQKSQTHLAHVLAKDPWNISYLILDILNLTKTSNLEPDLLVKDLVMEKLESNNEEGLDWKAFNHLTTLIETNHVYELAYARQKLAYVYANGHIGQLHSLVKTACNFNPSKGTYDFLRLLNTNFDSANIYWALGLLFKENWQLETAAMWFDQTLAFPIVPNSLKAKAYLELADCYNWKSKNLAKAIEFIKLAIELNTEDRQRAFTILAHSYLKLGQVRHAQTYLSEIEKENNPEAKYLEGLVQYRNGAQDKANKIWKPLLTLPSQNLRFHNIKQEILKYYFEKVPYEGIN